MLKKISIFALIMSVFFSLNSCKELESLATLATKCTYKVDNIVGYKVAGMDVKGKTSIKDFGIIDAAKITSSLFTKSLPIEMVVNVGVDNQGSEANIQKLDWIALIEGKEMLTGLIDKPINIPANGHGTIPFKVNVDLFEVLSGESGTTILNTALTLLTGEKVGESSKLSFKVRPTYNIAGIQQQHPSFIVINP
jgi:hypothetical protein